MRQIIIIAFEQPLQIKINKTVSVTTNQCQPTVILALARVWLFENCPQNSLEKELGHYGSSGHHGDTPEYHVFHVEFERVEIPFIIALWIFVSSLAKIGK